METRAERGSTSRGGEGGRRVTNWEFGIGSSPRRASVTLREFGILPGRVLTTTGLPGRAIATAQAGKNSEIYPVQEKRVVNDNAVISTDLEIGGTGNCIRQSIQVELHQKQPQFSLLLITK